jgi:hypothetical protein
LRWVGHIASPKEKRNACTIFEPERKSPLGRPGCMWKDNIEMDVREVVSEGVDWMHLAQDRNQWRAVMDTVMNLRVL